MVTTSIRDQLEKAKRIRDRRNWLMLAFIVVGLVPSAAIAALGIFPAIPEKYIFGGGLFVSVGLAHLTYAWQMRNVKKPSCPACGCDWEIIESGPGKNTSNFSEGGTCPKCGVAI